jgi:hypothetical protein
MRPILKNPHAKGKGVHERRLIGRRALGIAWRGLFRFSCCATNSFSASPLGNFEALISPAAACPEIHLDELDSVGITDVEVPAWGNVEDDGEEIEFIRAIYRPSAQTKVGNEFKSIGLTAPIIMRPRAPGMAGRGITPLAQGPIAI